MYEVAVRVRPLLSSDPQEARCLRCSETSVRLDVEENCEAGDVGAMAMPFLDADSGIYL